MLKKTTRKTAAKKKKTPYIPPLHHCIKTLIISLSIQPSFAKFSIPSFPERVHFPSEAFCWLGIIEDFERIQVSSLSSLL